MAGEWTQGCVAPASGPIATEADHAESLRQLQAFQHVRETKGAEACPAGWEPGQPTLKVGPDLVGKVWQIWKPNE